MWNCKSCGYENTDKARFCEECGTPRPAEAEPGPKTAQSDETVLNTQAASPAVSAPTPQPAGKKRRWWLWLLLALAVLAAAAVICYFAVHIWTPATCTEPAVCKICGKTNGLPLGHNANEATCTEPAVCSRCGETLTPALGHSAGEATCTEDSVCSRCGEVLAPALGHDWLPATYEEPETCSRCGETRGEALNPLVGTWTGTVDAAEFIVNDTPELDGYLKNAPVAITLELTADGKYTMNTDATTMIPAFKEAMRAYFEAYCKEQGVTVAQLEEAMKMTLDELIDSTFDDMDTGDLTETVTGAYSVSEGKIVFDPGSFARVDGVWSGDMMSFTIDIGDVTLYRK